MTKLRHFSGLLAILPIGGLLLAMPLQSRGTSGAAAGPAGPVGDEATAITKIWARDPLAHSMTFADGKEGMIFQDRQVKNCQSDLDFDNYNSGEFTVGIEGGAVGAIVDIGSPADLQAKYRYSETVGGGQGFASIRREGGEFVILGPGGKSTTQPLAEAKPVLGAGSSGAHARVQMGHVYLVRLQDTHNSKFERIAKFLVLAYVPGESVTIRWVRLEG